VRAERSRFLATGDPVTAGLLHRGETSHIEAGAERPPLAGQYYRSHSLFMGKPFCCRDNRLEHRGIERVHLVRPHQSDVGNAVRNRDRDALLHENFPPLLFLLPLYRTALSGFSQSTN
jgi:hypothetical protein